MGQREVNRDWRRFLPQDTVDGLVGRQIDIVRFGGLEGEAGKTFLAKISLTEAKVIPGLTDALMKSSGTQRDNFADALALAVREGGIGSDEAVASAVGWLGDEGLYEKAQSVFRLLAIRRRPADVSGLAEKLRAASAGDGFGQYNARNMLKLFDTGMDAELRLLESADGDKVVDGVRAVHRRIESALGGHDFEVARSVAELAMPRMLAAIKDKGADSAAGMYSVAAMMSWSKSDPSLVASAVIDSANPKSRRGVPVPHLADAAVGVLSGVLPLSGGERIVSTLMNRIVNDGVPDPLVIRALSGIGDEAKTEAIKRAKTAMDVDVVRGVGFLLALKGAEGVGEAFNMCETEDTTQLTNALVILSCMKLVKDGVIAFDEEPKKSLTEALDDGRLEATVRRCIYRGLLKDGDGPNGKVTGALIHIGAPAVRPLLDRAWDVTDAAELWTIGDSLGNMGMTSLPRVIEFAEGEDKDRKVKGMVLLAAFSMLAGDWPHRDRKKAEWGRVEALLSGERVKKLVDSAQSGSALEQEMAEKFKTGIKFI